MWDFFPSREADKNIVTLIFPYTNKKEVTFNVKYEIVLYTPVFNARCGGPCLDLISACTLKTFYNRKTFYFYFQVTTSAAEVEWAIALAEQFSLVLDGSRGITAVYLELSQISHSCRFSSRNHQKMRRNQILLKNCSPNTYHTCWSDRRLLVKAARPIAEGEPITFCKVLP